VADDQVDGADPELIAHELELAGEERLPGDLEHHLGDVSAARMQPLAAPGGTDHADTRCIHVRTAVRKPGIM